MITTANIKQRLDVIDKVIELYQNEKVALMKLTEIYRDPVYKDIRELESVIDRNQMPHLVSLPTGKESDKPKGKAGRKPNDNKNLYTTANLKIMYWIFENAKASNDGKHHEIKITTNPQLAKTIGCGSNTITKFLNTYRGNELKPLMKQTHYAISPDFYAVIEQAYAKATEAKEM